MTQPGRLGLAGLSLCGALLAACGPGGAHPADEARRPGGAAGSAHAAPPPVKAPVDASRPALAIDIGDGLTVEFVAIPAGRFVMGSDASREPPEKPEHEVTLTRAFYLGKYEVTQEQWRSVMGTEPSEAKGPKLPVDLVSWDDTQVFLAKLGERLGGLKLALPTEAQWEYAAHGGGSANWSFGDDIEQFKDHGWYDANSDGKPHPVGGKKPNGYGLYDMHGNVWEWCSDWRAPYVAGPVVDPTGPEATAGMKVIHGGSWRNSRALGRLSYRFGSGPSQRHTTVGFRVVLPLAP